LPAGRQIRGGRADVASLVGERVFEMDPHLQSQRDLKAPCLSAFRDMRAASFVARMSIHCSRLPRVTKPWD
jgi:hypothetical protein